MSIISRHPRTIAIGAACALTAGGIGVVTNAGAATAHSRASHAHKGRLARLERRAVHAQLTVPTKAGLTTITIDRGVVDSVSGDTLTITEGTRHVTGHRVTVTIPAGAKVRIDRKTAELSSLTAGERVAVVAGPHHTAVRARAAKAN